MGTYESLITNRMARTKQIMFKKKNGFDNQNVSFVFNIYDVILPWLFYL